VSVGCADSRVLPGASPLRPEFLKVANLLGLRRFKTYGEIVQDGFLGRELLVREHPEQQTFQ